MSYQRVELKVLIRKAMKGWKLLRIADLIAITDTRADDLPTRPIPRIRLYGQKCLGNGFFPSTQSFQQHSIANDRLWAGCCIESQYTYKKRSQGSVTENKGVTSRSRSSLLTGDGGCLEFFATLPVNILLNTIEKMVRTYLEHVFVLAINNLGNKDRHWRLTI